MSESVLGERYRVEARIGSGGMAEVYRGLDPVLNRTVAVKLLLPQFARDASFVARFRREAQAAARLNHPNIVGVYDSGSDDGTQYIVMEYIEGRTLAEALTAGRRPTPMQAADLARNVCSALAAAHAQGVIHRDIKPGNIMVTRDGTVKVMDFGIARLTGGPETAPQTSAVFGTASYLSPEQAQGQPVDARTDIYSLGTVLYEMLAGRPPFTGDSPVSVAYKQVNETPVPPSRMHADVPPQLDAVVMKALSKNPANRYQTAQEFSDDLERVVGGRDVGATPLMPVGGDATQVISRPHPTSVLPPQVEEEGGGRKVWLGILIGILIVALLGGGGYVLVNSLTGDNGGSGLVLVPNVLGDPFDDAEAELDGLGLVVQRRNSETTTERPGIVFKQDPEEGTPLAEGGTVFLTVAKAPTTTIVPDLFDKTVAEAQVLLNEAELRLATPTDEPSSEIEAGHIISQDPPADEEVDKDSFVTVVVSSGPPMVTIPSDIICRSVASVSNELSRLGLTVVDGGTRPPNPDCPTPNRVVASEPQPGTSVQEGSTVVLYEGGLPSPSPSGE